MATRNVRIVMNGVTGRMGYRQHLLRSVLAIRDDGGITLPDGGRLQVEPVLVGRNHAKLAGIARAHDVADFTTDLDAALADESATVYFDAQATGGRRKTILTAIAAGKHVYTEKPIAKSVEEGRELAQAADSAGIVNGVVHDKLFLPGLLKLKRLLDSGFFGRIMSVRCEFGYWVFPGDVQPAQPELELPRRGGRRHRPGHVLALELRPGGPVRPGARGDRARYGVVPTAAEPRGEPRQVM